MKTEQNSTPDLSVNLRFANNQTIEIGKEKWEHLLRNSKTLQYLYNPKFNLLTLQKTESGDITAPTEIDLSYLSKKDWDIVAPFVGPMGNHIHALKKLDLSFRDSLSLLMSSRYLELTKEVESAAYKQAVKRVNSSGFLKKYAQSPFPITITTDVNGDNLGLVTPDLSFQIAKGALLPDQKTNVITCIPISKNKIYQSKKYISQSACVLNTPRQNALSKMINEEKFFIEHLLLIRAAVADLPIAKMLALSQKFYETLEPELQQIVKTAYQAQQSFKNQTPSFAERFWQVLASRVLHHSPIKKSAPSNPATTKSDADNLD